MNEIRKSVASKHSSAASADRTYSHTGSRGEAWNSPTPSPLPCGDSESRYSRVSGGDDLARPVRRERGAAREVVEREHVDDREVVVAGEADRAVGGGQRHARVRLGAVPDQVAEAPELVRAVGLRRRDHRLKGLLVAVDVGRDGDAHWWSYRLFGAQSAPPAGHHRRRAGGGGGGGLPDAAARPAGAGRRRAANLLQHRVHRAGGGLPQRTAAAVRRAAGDRDRPAGVRGAAAAGAAEGGVPPARAGRRRHRRRALRSPSPW